MVVCVRQGSAYVRSLAQAEPVAGGIFEAIGVRVEFRNGTDRAECGDAVAIEIRLDSPTPMGFHPRAHEIGDVLERSDRHAVDGVMKARFDNSDVARMMWSRLAFDATDAGLLGEAVVERRGH